MSNYNRNRFRLETVSSETASPGRIVTVNLPENALLDMRSFKFHFDVSCNSVTVGGATVRGRLPPDASSLISRVEVFINGIHSKEPRNMAPSPGFSRLVVPQEMDPSIVHCNILP